MRTKLLPLIAVAALTVLLAACGSDATPSASSADQSTKATVDFSTVDFTDMTGKSSVTIEAVDNNFVPQYVTISPGTTVTFVNKGRNKHDIAPVVADDFMEIPSDAFAPGTSTVVHLGTKTTFDTPGDFPYYCTLHGTTSKGIVGGIRVAAK